MQIPIPQSIVDKLGSRLWDGIVQAFADELRRCGRPDWADRVKKLRVHPDLPELMRAAVVTGWNFWLDNSSDRRLAEAAREQAPSLSSTLVSFTRHAVGDPLQRVSVEATFAEWFATLYSGATFAQCEQAAKDLLHDIFKAAQRNPELQVYVVAALAWEDVERKAVPVDGSQVAMVRSLAQAEAARDRCKQYSTAHMLFGLAARAPRGHVQAALDRCGLDAGSIAVELGKIHFSRHNGPSYLPGPSLSVAVLVDQARALAERQGVLEIGDLHLAVAAVLLAEDKQCGEGQSIRLIFEALGVSPASLLEKLAARTTWPTLEQEDPGLLLSSQGL